MKLQLLLSRILAKITITLMPFVISCIALAAIMLPASCSKLIEIDLPQDRLESKAVFEDSIDATSAVTGLYSRIMTYSTGVNFGSGLLTVYTGLLCDELEPLTTAAVDLQFFQNAVTPDNITKSDWWDIPFEYIYHANACIEGLNNSRTLSTPLKNRLSGEMYYMRAWLFFNLTNLYGSIPLPLSTDYRMNSQLARSSQQIVYEQVLSDLTIAESLLDNMPVESNRSRPNKYAVMGLMSRVYLYTKQWQQAADKALQVINSGIFKLEDNLDSVFLSAGKEALFQMPVLQAGFGVPEAYLFVPGQANSQPKYKISSLLMSSLEPGDKREQSWIKSTNINGINYRSPFKYKAASLSTGLPLEYYAVMRLGELYLNLSEAKAHLSEFPLSLQYLNAIRQRAGLMELSFTTSGGLLQSIYEERRREFFCEWGHRWFDLKRTGFVQQVLQPIKPSWSAYQQLLPIPRRELETNTHMDQNQGY
ncbi:RagB/SusD family nutrient uptake outer membrane protein [Niabella yanshanensis]|uniref:RagB/SusD family nutrient uptake outer membrane protein n=1 Tax=Niabella yanshanensis TaxID=577386 RepID=A0ABZ0W132_9BACT|nr:RagB/SusD family nutrient uptake outer membrane protein [Niabella yanshanensis]WQD36781.1 RagB/SusD family nutrient uptake outer membrane protein [Niabella yanshanensis]